MNEQTLLWIVVAILALFLLGPILSGLGWMGGWGHGWMMGPWMMGRWCGWGGQAPWGAPWIFWLPPLIQLLLLIGLGVVVIVLLARSRPPAEGSPLEILRKRYAAGEISKEEFEEARRILGV